MIKELEQYREVAPKGTIDFLHRLSDLVQGKRFLHINTFGMAGGWWTSCVALSRS